MTDHEMSRESAVDIRLSELELALELTELIVEASPTEFGDLAEATAAVLGVFEESLRKIKSLA